MELVSTTKNNLAAGLEGWARKRQREFESNVVYNLNNAPAEWGWSWDSIVGVYAALGKVFISYNEINKRINIPRPDINMSDDENIFVMRFWGDIDRINAQLEVLEKEMARRRKLIGVF